MIHLSKKDAERQLLRVYDKSITFLDKTIVEDESSFKKEKWVPYKSVYVSARNLKGRIFYAAAQAQMETTVEFYMPYSEDLCDEERRIEFQGEIYEIIPPVDDIDFRHQTIRIRGKRIEGRR